MTENEPKPFNGFKTVGAPAAFEVLCHDIQVFRQWRIALDGETPEFLSSIHGQATGADDVCVFETGRRSRTFDLAVYPDQKIKASWENIKGNELVVDRLEDPECLRIRNLQYERFDKSPPTATLFYSGGFSLACNISATVLERLASDLGARYVATIRMKIEWCFPFVDKQSGVLGLFEDGQLRGHISSFTWSFPKAVESPKG